MALPLSDLKVQLDAATSDELRILRAYIGFGKAGTKDMNKALIYEHVETIREGAAFDNSQPDLDDESFADSGMA